MGDWLEIFEDVAATWRPGPEVTTDEITFGPAAAFAALLDQDCPVAGEGDPLPPLWHWLFHLPVHPQAVLGADGHPRGTGLLPPLPDDRRRMFGGGTLQVHEPLRCGDQVTRRSEVASARATTGSSGPLLLTSLRHTLEVDGQLRVVEEQQVVYLPPRDLTADAAGEVDTTAIAADGTGCELTFSTDPVRLFRFSALTANAHRIHYDRAFARDIEGHPDLVVHGPLSALLLAELPRRHAPDRPVSHLQWRARKPVFVGQPLRVRGPVPGGEVDEIDLALDAASTTDAVVATATLAREAADT